MSFNNIRNLLGLPQEDQDIYDVPRFEGSNPQRVPTPTPEMNLQNTAGQPAGLNEAAKNAISAFKMTSPMAYALDTAGNPQARGNVLEQVDPSHATGMADSTLLKFLKVNPEEFVNATKSAVQKRPLIKDFITQYEPKDLQGSKLFLTSDKASGLAVKPDLDISSVFSLEKGRGNQLVEKSLAEGGKKLDAFEGYLTNELYPRHGFLEYNRSPNWTPGNPDVVFMGQPDYLKNLIRKGLVPGNMKTPEEAARYLALKKKLGM
jgi:hypothetical protein